MQLLFATSNRKKLLEAESILTPLGISVSAADPLEVEESEFTFEGNAEKKAREYALHYRSYCLADDSGLTVEHLGNLPGVFSARFAALDIDWNTRSVRSVSTRNCKDEENLMLLLKLLDGVSNRAAAYYCAVSLATPDGKILFTESATCPLRVLHTPKGTGGFGYDPICSPLDERFSGKSFAELTLEEKNSLSHRGKALRQLAERLRTHVFSG